VRCIYYLHFSGLLAVLIKISYLFLLLLRTADVKNSIDSLSKQGGLEMRVWPMADVSIIECDGYPGCDVAHSEVAMADLMVVMLEDTNRAEHMLGDIMLRAWRMRSTVRVVFVKPKFDEIYKRKDSPRCVNLICCNACC
jgi:hypothetical protein